MTAQLAITIEGVVDASDQFKVNFTNVDGQQGFTYVPKSSSIQKFVERVLEKSRVTLNIDNPQLYTNAQPRVLINNLLQIQQLGTINFILAA